MNHIYRLVWNALNRAWVAVAEIARGKGKGSGTVGVCQHWRMVRRKPDMHPQESTVGCSVGSPIFSVEVLSMATNLINQRQYQ